MFFRYLFCRKVSLQSKVPFSGLQGFWALKQNSEYSYLPIKLKITITFHHHYKLSVVILRINFKTIFSHLRTNFHCLRQPYRVFWKMLCYYTPWFFAESSFFVVNTHFLDGIYKYFVQSLKIFKKVTNKQTKPPRILSILEEQFSFTDLLRRYIYYIQHKTSTFPTSQ